MKFCSAFSNAHPNSLIFKQLSQAQYKDDNLCILMGAGWRYTIYLSTCLQDACPIEAGWNRAERTLAYTSEHNPVGACQSVNMACRSICEISDPRKHACLSQLTILQSCYPRPIQECGLSIALNGCGLCVCVCVCVCVCLTSYLCEMKCS